MKNEEQRKRIAEASYRRGFAGGDMDGLLEAERALAALTASEPEPQAEEPSMPPQPDQASGAAIPVPLAKEDRIRAEEVKQSARELAEASGAKAKDKPGVQPIPAGKKLRTREPGAAKE